jgi:hypothetical protein
MWSSKETVGPVLLSSMVRGDQVERVKYLPQGYIEKVCASAAASSSGLFEAELNRVIFSNIPVEDRRDFRDLESLIDDDTSEVKRLISRLKADVRGVNVQIVQVRERLLPEARERIQRLLESKTLDLKTVSEAPPVLVPEPATDAATKDAISVLLSKLQDAQAEARSLSEQVTATVAELTSVKTQQSGLTKLDQRLLEVEATIKAFLDDFAPVAAAVGFTMSDVVHVQIERSPVERAISALQSATDGLLAKLDTKSSRSLVSLLAQKEKDVAEAQASLDEPNRRYQAYLAEVLAWEKHKAEITGDGGTPGTLMFLQRQLNEIDEVLPVELTTLEGRRDELMLAVFEGISKQADIYRRYYARVQEALDERIEHKNVGLRFNVAIGTETLEDRFFGMVSHNAVGTFCGVQDGRKQLAKIVRSHPFESPVNALAFTRAVMFALSWDLRYQKPVAVAWEEKSLRGNAKPKQLLDFIFTLEFLEPKYELRMGGRTLQELSPGERGLLLLFFYLAVDRDTTPLILDQPDENLDNESIKETLVPLIQGAKRRRQVFVVTHNPNLAVVCDAEQVIFAQLDPSEDHIITYTAGAIENPTINKHIVDVLEGTPPAFRNRHRKYTSVGSL